VTLFGTMPLQQALAELPSVSNDIVLSDQWNLFDS